MLPIRSNRLWELRWDEVAALDRDATLILQPAGAIEQHGYHLPLDTDIHDASEICYRVAEAANAAAGGTVLVAPPIWWGTSPYHLSYPGTISLRLETLSQLLVDIVSSLGRQGFYRFLIVNGHGGNSGILAATAVRISEEVGIRPALVTYWNLVLDTLREIGTSPKGGMGHACELETSIQLHLRPEGVDMSKAVAELGTDRTSFSCTDFREPGPVMIPFDFERESRDGVMGDPTVATEAKGKTIVDATIAKLLMVSRELLSLSEHDLTSRSRANQRRPRDPAWRNGVRAGSA